MSQFTTEWYEAATSSVTFFTNAIIVRSGGTNITYAGVFDSDPRSVYVIKTDNQ